MVKEKTLSHTGQRWVSHDPATEEFFRKFPEYPRPIAQLLHNRGLDSDTAIGSFLNPVYTRDVHSPRQLGGVDQAVGVIFDAIKTGRKITVHGDYDADGLTSAALLHGTLQRLGADADMFVPSRYVEGYGVSAATLEKLQQNGTGLVITVDCGISNAKEIAAAREKGLQVVVTDHHLPPPEVPPAEAVINPNLPDDPYPNKALTGVGVAFKLAQALLAQSDLTEPQREAAEKWLLDLVAIGTVADLASLTGENRTLVKFGLVVLSKTRRPGLAALLKVCSIDPATLDTSRIGYAIAPRLNAAGRVTSPEVALDLLTTADAHEGQQLAEHLTSLNATRQNLTEQALLEAKAALGEVTDQRRVLVVAGKWKSGIVGLIAGKLAQEFHRPALVIEQGRQYSTGSARSIPALNIVEALRAQQGLLSAFGGHKAAAGFSLPTENLTAFREQLESYCLEHLTVEDLAPELVVEAELAPAELDAEFMDRIEAFAPFGIDNPRPTVKLSGVTVSQAQVVGRDESHLKLSLSDGEGAEVSAICFGFAAHRAHLRPGTKVDVVGSPVTETFNGTKRLTLHVADFRST